MIENSLFENQRKEKMIENSFFENQFLVGTNFPISEEGRGVQNPKNSPFIFVPIFQGGEGVT